MTTETKKFEFGQIVATRGVAEDCATNILFNTFVKKSLRRHLSGDWGDMCAEDKQSNEDALVDGNRLMSAYEERPLPKIWIITEADRSVTTILFPDEY